MPSLSDVLALAKHTAVGFGTGFTSPGNAKPGSGPFVGKERPVEFTVKGKNGEAAPFVRSKAPVMLEMAPAAIYQLYNLGAKAAQKGGVNIPTAESKLLDQWSEDFHNADQNVRKAVNVGEPTNALEVAAEAAGMLLTPGPKVRVAKQIIKPLNAPTVGGKIAQAAGNTGRVVAQGAVEAILPGNNTGLKAVPIGAGLAAGASELIDGVYNTPDYMSIADTAHMVLQPHKVNKYWGEYLPEETRVLYNQALQEGDEEYADYIQKIGEDLKSKDMADAYMPPPPVWEQAKVDTAVLAATAIAAWTTHRIANGVKARLMHGTELAGKEFTESFSGADTKIVQGMLQNDQAVRDATKHMTGDAGKFFGESRGLQQWKAKFDGISVPSLQPKVHHFMTTGQLPNSAIKSKPLAPTLEAIAQLNPMERSMLTDGLLAKTALDDWQRTGKATSFKLKQDGTPYTYAELQNLVKLGEQGNLKGYADNIRQHYRDQLDYMLEQGYISEEWHTRYRLDRPNFVHLSKNATDDDLAGLMGADRVGQRPPDTIVRARSTDEGGGVQAGATADPIVDLPNQWAEVIHKVQINDVKRDWLKASTGNAELKKIISEVPINNGEKNVHTVRVDGKEVHYKIKDQALSEALEFSPFTQRSVWAQVMDVPRKLFQQGTTGIGNPLFAGTAAVYDTVMGINFRPKGYQLGVINEFLNKASKGKYNVGGFDPTMWVSAPIGAVRYAYDSMVGSVAHELATQLERGSGLSLSMLGPQNTDTLKNLFANAYSSSIKSVMEETGAAGASPFLASMPDKLAPGMATIAPKFNSEATKLAAVAALKGDASKAEFLLQASKIPWEMLRASPIARLYSGTMRAMHEGFRYQAFATNYAKGALKPEELELLASQTRRVAADIGQVGGSKLQQNVNHSVAYLNIAMQSFGEMGRKLKAQPVTTMANMMSGLVGLAILRYGAMATNPDVRAEMRLKSDSQNAAGFTTFGGLHFNIPQEARLYTAPIFAALDHMMGVHNLNEDGTDNFNMNILPALEAWLDGGTLSERMKQSMWESEQAALGQAMPINLASVPAVNAAFALGGMDVPFSQFTGRGEPIRQQQEGPMFGQGVLMDDSITATWQNAIMDVIGSGTFAYARATMDYFRATGDGGKMEDGMKIAFSRLADQNAMQNGPLQGLIFRGYEKVQGVNDTDARLWYNKRQGLDVAKTTLNTNILSVLTNSLNPQNALISQLSPEKLMANMEDIGTQNMLIGKFSAELIRSLTPVQAHVGQLQKQITDIQNQSVSTSTQWQYQGGKQLSTIEERNKQINQLNDERRYYIGLMLRQTQTIEDSIRQAIGDPSFTFQHYEPAKYRKPLQPMGPAPIP